MAKLAMDDFFAAGGPALELYAKAVPLAVFLTKLGLGADNEDAEPIDHIEKLRSEYLVTENPRGAIYSIGSDEFIPKERLEIATKTIPPVKKSKGARVTYISAAADYLASPQRRVVKGIVFDPSQPSLTETPTGYFNNCAGLDVEPIEGDARAFEDHLSWLTREEPEHRDWARQWCAYPLQHPGAKLHQAFVIQGDQHAGKSLFGITLGEIYGGDRPGSYFRAINSRMLRGSFNPFAYKARLTLGNEITGSDRRSDADNLKDMIDRKTVEVNRKHQPQITVKDCCNYIFTSNHGDALYLEDPNGDRRYFVVHVSGTIPQALADRVWALGHTPEGRSALLCHLLNVDLTGFDPHGPAPRTRAQANMFEDSGSDLDSYIRGVIDFTNQGGRPEVITAEMLTREYNDKWDRSVAVKAVGHSLKRAGARRLPKVRLADRTLLNPWALANFEQWKSRDAEAIRTALEEYEKQANQGQTHAKQKY
jgi:uncharacterized protein DUF5906